MLPIVLALLAVLFAATPAAATTVISSWGTTITVSNETYILTADLVEPPASQGIDDFAIAIAPGVSRVVIDGGGFLIDGKDASGTPDDDLGIGMAGTAASPIRDVVVRDLRFTDLGKAVSGQDFLCDIVVEDCEFSGVNDWSAIEFITLTGGAALQWVTVRENWIHDSAVFPIKLFNYANAGAGSTTFEHIYIVGNVIHGCSRSPAHAESWNAAIGFRHGGADLRVWDNVVLSGSGESGLFIGSNDVAGDTYDQVSIRGNHFGAATGNIHSPGSVLASGITLEQVRTTAGTFATWTVGGNYLYQNENKGIDLIPGAGPSPLPTSGNWWGEDGTVSGTYGNGAANATDSAPLDLADGILARADRAGIDRALSDQEGYLAEVVLLNQNNGAPGIRGFNVDYDFSLSVVRKRTIEGPFLRRQAPVTTFFDVARIGGSGNERTASGSILGGAAPLAVGNGALLAAIFRAGPQDLAPADDFDLDGAELRDPVNVPVPVAGTDGADRRIDDTDPVIGLAPTLGDDCVSTATIDVNVTASDNFALEDVVFRFYKNALGPGCFTPLALDEAGTAYTGPSPVTVTFMGGDGLYTFEVRATDDAGNAATASITLVHDTTPPADFAGTTAAVAVAGPGTPAVEEVRVTWSGSFEAGGDLRLRYLPYGGAPGNFAYPEYDDAAPVPGPHFPSSTEGTEIDVPDVASGAVTIPYPIAERSYYYYVLYVVDCGSNYSPGTAASTRARALSYYLGDWDPNGTPACAGSPVFASGNGQVNFCDLIGLSATFGTVNGNVAFSPYADIGPTTPGPGVLDLPATDNVIDFEDLILLAINFGNVFPLGGDIALDDADEATGPPAIALELGTAGDTGVMTVRLTLATHGQAVRGFEAVVAHAAGLRFLAARPGPALGGDQVFFRALGCGASAVSVNAAVLAGAFRGSGIVAELDYAVLEPAGASGLELKRAKIRDPGNRELGGAVAAVAPEAVAERPGTRGFSAPAPNPAFGRASLRFVLDAPAAVRLRIYDAGGRLVRRLLEEPLAAGEHTVEWDGRSDAGAAAPSGIYLVDLTGGAVREVRKLILVR